MLLLVQYIPINTPISAAVISSFPNEPCMLLFLRKCRVNQQRHTSQGLTLPITHHLTMPAFMNALLAAHGGLSVKSLKFEHLCERWLLCCMLGCLLGNQDTTSVMPNLHMDLGGRAISSGLGVASRLVLVGPALRQEALRFWERSHVQGVDGHL